MTAGLAVHLAPVGAQLALARDERLHGGGLGVRERDGALFGALSTDYEAFAPRGHAAHRFDGGLQVGVVAVERERCRVALGGGAQLVDSAGVLDVAAAGVVLAHELPEGVEDERVEVVGGDACRIGAAAGSVVDLAAVEAASATACRRVHGVAAADAAGEADGDVLVSSWTVADRAVAAAAPWARRDSSGWVLRGFPCRAVDDRGPGVRVDVVAVAQLAEVGAVLDEAVHGGLGPVRGAHAGLDAVLDEELAERGRAVASGPKPEELDHDGRDVGVRLGGSSVAVLVEHEAQAGRHDRLDGDAGFDGACLRAAEGGAEHAPLVVAVREREVHLQLTVGRRPFGVLGVADDLPAGFVDALGERKRLSHVAREAVELRDDDPRRLAGLDALDDAQQPSPRWVGAALVGVVLERAGLEPAGAGGVHRVLVLPVARPQSLRAAADAADAAVAVERGSHAPTLTPGGYMGKRQFCGFTFWPPQSSHTMNVPSALTIKSRTASGRLVRPRPSYSTEQRATIRRTRGAYRRASAIVDDADRTRRAVAR